VRSTGFSPGVAKKELSTANLMVEKAAKLDRDTFGVAVGPGPLQRRLEEIGGTHPALPISAPGGGVSGSTSFWPAPVVF
jgi:hypothetical protein